MDKENKYQENWDFFFTEIGGNPASIYLDLGLNRIAPVKDLPVLLTIEIEMNFPQENGFSSKQESGKLFEIEDILLEELKKASGSIMAGRITTDGLRILYFYTARGKEAKKSANEVLKRYNDYTCTVETEKDHSWEKYREYLYPSGYELHTIMNRHVVENLRRQGDDLSMPREVDHYIYFNSEKGKNSFLIKAKELGYKLASEKKETGGKDYPFSVRVSRLDQVEYDAVCDYTSELYDLAEENEGTYDGWETKVITTQKETK